MSKTLYMTVCSKNVLFSVCQSNEQLSKPLLNGIFSRTEPPTAIIDIKRSRRKKEGGSGAVRGGIDMRLEILKTHAYIFTQCSV